MQQEKQTAVQLQLHIVSLAIDYPGTMIFLGLASKPWSEHTNEIFQALLWHHTISLFLVVALPLVDGALIGGHTEIAAVDALQAVELSPQPKHIELSTEEEESSMESCWWKAENGDDNEIVNTHEQTDLH